MDLRALEQLFADRDRTQREKLRLLADEWRPAFAAMDDETLDACLRLIRKTINSKRLKAARDELLAELRGEPPPEPAKVVAPPPKPEPEPEPEPSPGRYHPALEARLAEDPNSRELRQVYRDWLETHGLVSEGRVVLGPLAEADDMLGEVDWHLGFIRSCRLSYSSARFNGERPELSIEDALAALLDDPGPGRFVRALTIGLALHDDNDYAGVCEVIGRRPRPTLEELFIGDFGYEECELNWSRIRDTAAMWRALPRLRKLSLRAGSMRLTGIDLPELRTLETITGGMRGAALAAIAGGRWPKLERLQLQIGLAREHAATDVELLEPLFAGDHFPALTHLGLTNCEMTDEICARLPGTPILARIRSLDLQMGTMSMAGVEAMLRRAEDFAHLEHIDVDDNYLPPEAEAMLDTLGPEVIFGSQRDDDGDGRYASAFE